MTLETFANRLLRLYVGRNWLMFNATVAEAESLFDTEYYYFGNDRSEGYRIACDKYHLPQHVQKHVDFAVRPSDRNDM